MKKFLSTTLGGLAVACVALQTVPTMAANDDACSGPGKAGFCVFGSLYDKDYCQTSNNKEPQCHVKFECTVGSDATHVNFANHNVLITGFGIGTGKLTLAGAELKELQKYYYDVVNDFSHNQGDPKTVTFDSDGTISCRIVGQAPGAYGR